MSETTTTTRACAVPGCPATTDVRSVRLYPAGRAPESHDLCFPHREVARDGGLLEARPLVTLRIGAGSGAPAPSSSLEGLLGSADLLPPRPVGAPPSACPWTGCKNAAMTIGLCATHLQRARQLHRPQPFPTTAVEVLELVPVWEERWVDERPTTEPPALFTRAFVTPPRRRQDRLPQFTPTPPVAEVVPDHSDEERGAPMEEVLTVEAAPEVVALTTDAARPDDLVETLDEAAPVVAPPVEEPMESVSAPTLRKTIRRAGGTKAKPAQAEAPKATRVKAPKPPKPPKAKKPKKPAKAKPAPKKAPAPKPPRRRVVDMADAHYPETRRCLWPDCIARPKVHGLCPRDADRVLKLVGLRPRDVPDLAGQVAGLAAQWDARIAEQNTATYQARMLDRGVVPPEEPPALEDSALMQSIPDDVMEQAEVLAAPAEVEVETAVSVSVSETAPIALEVVVEDVNAPTTEVLDLDDAHKALAQLRALLDEVVPGGAQRIELNMALNALEGRISAMEDAVSEMMVASEHTLAAAITQVAVKTTEGLGLGQAVGITGALAMLGQAVRDERARVAQAERAVEDRIVRALARTIFAEAPARREAVSRLAFSVTPSPEAPKLLDALLKRAAADPKSAIDVARAVVRSAEQGSHARA